MKRWSSPLFLFLLPYSPSTPHLKLVRLWSRSLHMFGSIWLWQCSLDPDAAIKRQPSTRISCSCWPLTHPFPVFEKVLAVKSTLVRSTCMILSQPCLLFHRQEPYIGVDRQKQERPFGAILQLLCILCITETKLPVELCNLGRVGGGTEKLCNFCITCCSCIYNI